MDGVDNRKTTKLRIGACALLAAALLCAPCGYSQDRPEPAVGAERRARTTIDLMGHGKRLLAQGDLRRAAMEFEKVIQLDPSNTAAADLLAECMAAVSCVAAGEQAR